MRPRPALGKCLGKKFVGSADNRLYAVRFRPGQYIGKAMRIDITQTRMRVVKQQGMAKSSRMRLTGQRERHSQPHGRGIFQRE